MKPKPTAICSECGKEFTLGFFKRTCSKRCSDKRQRSRSSERFSTNKEVTDEIIRNVELAKIGQCPGVESKEDQVSRAPKGVYRDMTDVRMRRVVMR